MPLHVTFLQSSFQPVSKRQPKSELEIEAAQHRRLFHSGPQVQNEYSSMVPQNPANPATPIKGALKGTLKLYFTNKPGK